MTVSKPLTVKKATSGGYMGVFARLINCFIFIENLS